MELIITQEHSQDFAQVNEVIYQAFANEKMSDKNEHNLVRKLRNSLSFIPELSIVAKLKNTVVGHILFTKAQVVNGKNSHEILVLAPVSVHPDYQGNGIGSNLINYGLKLALELGYTAVSVMGHETYYPKFGFKPASSFQIKAPFEIPAENFMIIELKENSLSSVSGIIQYAPEFGC